MIGINFQHKYFQDINFMGNLSGNTRMGGKNFPENIYCDIFSDFLVNKDKKCPK